MNAPASNASLITWSLVKYFKSRKVVDSVSLEILAGEIVGLLGPNGAGKTTTFNMIIGLVTPDKGEVALNGEKITRLPMYKRARMGIGYLPQEPSVFRKLTVEENLLAILEHSGCPAKERRERAASLLEEFGIGHLAKQLAYTLSGGERRRLEICRALVNSPYFIMLDEPFSGVDPISVFSLQELIRKLRDRGIGILLTDHSVRETLEVVDRAYLIYEGRVEVSGSSHELVSNPHARRVYLGEQFTFQSRSRRQKKSPRSPSETGT
ncbi:MAG: LPS export ABC transporter ATP-binding protein [Candidatus Abyssobacteria bacterium SURF_17]|uniref:LPS export ABC transporter ATP-binding protein n=1 Tax=Candidatus Abyssobacteria bacterium SURF_17 TaxID=2093361 RepID=A0A419F684_9BACT|nr:MAG: LPS export ABC transporter ATP-binding protein [Candidatus Abyssubacteria bacterium SURF_17]